MEDLSDLIIEALEKNDLATLIKLLQESSTKLNESNIEQQKLIEGMMNNDKTTDIRTR